MELPISPSSYQPDDQTRWRVICDGYATMAQASVEPVGHAAAQCFIHPGRQGVRLVNMTQVDPRSSLMDPPSFPSQLAAVLDAYTQAGSACEMILWREPLVPAWADEAIIQRGYVKQARTIMAVTSYQPPAALEASFQIIPARAAYPKLHACFHHQARMEHQADDALADALAATWLASLDEPGLEMLVALVDGKLVASAGVLGIGRHALLWPAWCDKAYRKRGIARQLMHHVLAFCERAQFTDVLLDRAADCWSIPFYESLGMKAVAAGVKYKRAPAG